RRSGPATSRRRKPSTPRCGEATTCCAVSRRPPAKAPVKGPGGGASERERVWFRSAWLPYALLAPQIAVTLVFFIWPASQALWQSFFMEDAFGFESRFVWFENFETLFAASHGLAAVRPASVWSAVVAVSGRLVALVLAAPAEAVGSRNLPIRLLQ